MTKEIPPNKEGERVERMKSPGTDTASSIDTTTRIGIYLHFIITKPRLEIDFLVNPSPEIGCCDVGRLETSKVVVDDSWVSTRHFEVMWNKGEGTFHIRDFNSRMGTYVDGEKIGSDWVPLKINSIVSFGRGHRMYLHENPSPSLPSMQTRTVPRRRAVKK